MIQLVKLYLRLWFKHQVSMRAAALTYTFILAIVPAIAVCVSVISVIFDVKKKYQTEFKLFLLKNLAAGAGDSVTRYLDGFINNVRFKTIGFVGFTALIITSLLLLSSVENSINRIWSIQKPKKIWKRVLIYNLILIFGPICLSLSLTATAFVNKFMPGMLVQANLSAVFLNTLLLTFVYTVMPNQKVQIRSAFISALLVAVAFELAKWGFTLYTAKTLFYNKVYGSLAALPFLLIWIYVNWCLFLAGTLLHYVLQNGKSFTKRVPRKKHEEPI